MKNTSTCEKTPFLTVSVFWENAALLLILGVLALRSVFIEVTYYTAPASPFLLLPEPVNSLLISFVLLAVFFVHQVLFFLHPPSGQISIRLTLWIGVFVLLGFFSAASASNKRDAITELTTLAAALLIIPTVSELFRKPDRILLFLWVLTALGITAVYQCREQALSDNEAVLRNYEQNPQKVLEEVGIEPGTLKHWQFEHRLRSKDIRGFLTTSNSTGSFLLLCLFGSLGLLRYAFSLPARPERLIQILLYSSAVLCLGYGLFLCRSRGAITAGLSCLFGWIGCLWLGKRLWAFRGQLLTAALLCAAAAVCWAVWYGMHHGRLPGPNALLVRWQYWVSTVQMIAEHPLRGIGGGNFTIWYPLYKIPAAPELIRDPHNFPLSLAAQYGIPAALVFAGILIVPLTAVLRHGPCRPAPSGTGGPTLSSGLLLMAVCAVVLLMVRPWVIGQVDAEADSLVRGAYFLVYYLAPAGVMLLCLWLFVLAGRVPTDSANLQRALLPALGWGISAVLIHNLIDFALFETAVLTAGMLCLGAFWALGAAPSSVSNRKISVRLACVFGPAAVFAVWTYGAVWLPLRAGLLLQQALRTPAQSICLLRAAEAKDPLSPQPAWYQGQILFQQAEKRTADRQPLLEEARKAFTRALSRNPMDYRLMEALGDLFTVWAESENTEDVRTSFYQTSYEWTLQAWQRFPGSDRLVYKLGTLSERLNRPQEAAGWYTLAVQIEDEYRRQFRQMYPNDPIFSRLGESRYQYARDYALSHTAAPAPPESPPSRP
ncbi:MAG: O-antigen ligase family protein [Anaerohalosphaeraceae bacterium]